MSKFVGVGDSFFSFNPRTDHVISVTRYFKKSKIIPWRKYFTVEIEYFTVDDRRTVTHTGIYKKGESDDLYAKLVEQLFADPPKEEQENDINPIDMLIKNHARMGASSPSYPRKRN